MATIVSSRFYKAKENSAVCNQSDDKKINLYVRDLFFTKGNEMLQFVMKRLVGRFT